MRALALLPFLFTLFFSEGVSALRPLSPAERDPASVVGLEEALLPRVISEGLERAARRLEEAAAPFKELQDKEAFLSQQIRFFEEQEFPKGVRPTRDSEGEFYWKKLTLILIAKSILEDEVLPALARARQRYEKELMSYDKLKEAAQGQAIAIPFVEPVGPPDLQPLHDPRIVPEGALDLDQEVPLPKRIPKSNKLTQEELQWLARALVVTPKKIGEFIAKEEIRATRKKRAEGLLKRRRNAVDLEGLIVQILRPRGRTAFELLGAWDRLSTGWDNKKGVHGSRPLGRLIGDYEELKSDDVYRSVRRDLKALPQDPFFTEGLRHAALLGIERTLEAVRGSSDKEEAADVLEADLRAEGLLNPQITSVGLRMARMIDPRLPFWRIKPGDPSSAGLSPEEEDRLVREHYRQPTYVRQLVEEFPAEIAWGYYSRKDHERLRKLRAIDRARETFQALAAASPEGLRDVGLDDVRAIRFILSDPVSAGSLEWGLLIPHQNVPLVKKREVSRRLRLRILSPVVAGLGFLEARPELRDEVKRIVLDHDDDLRSIVDERIDAVPDPLEQAGLLLLGRAYPSVFDGTALARRLVRFPESDRQRARLFGSDWKDTADPGLLALRTALAYLVARGDQEVIRRLLEELQRYNEESKEMARANPHTLPVALSLVDGAKVSGGLQEKALRLLLQQELLDRLGTIKDWRFLNHRERLVSVLTRLRGMNPSQRAGILQSVSVEPGAVLLLLGAPMDPPSRRLLEEMVPFEWLPKEVDRFPAANLAKWLALLDPEVSGRLLYQVAQRDAAKARVVQIRLNYFRRVTESGRVRKILGGEDDNHYAILGVARGTSGEELRKAYLRLVDAFHPDLHPGDAQAAEEFSRITVAYQTLGNPSKRHSYEGGILRRESDFTWPSQVRILPEEPPPAKGMLALPSGQENAGLEEMLQVEAAGPFLSSQI